MAGITLKAIQKKFAATRHELNAALIERVLEIDMILVALLARESVLFVGPPGTGKSLMADAVVAWMDGQQFSILLTKFSTPEEVFGPISVVGLKKDEYRRVPDFKLPTCDIAFIDEIFKASSAILNTTLKVLNERVWLNHNKHVKCPMQLCIAASNEWPGDQDGGKELGALFDRFLLRREVRPIASERGLDQLLWGGDHTPKLSTKITPAEVEKAREAVKTIPWSPSAKESYSKIIAQCRKEGIYPGDRRLYKSILVCQASAFLAGASEVQNDHLEMLANTMWDDPEEQPVKAGEIVGRIANPQGMAITGLLAEAVEVDKAVRDAVGEDGYVTRCIDAIKKYNEILPRLEAIPGDRAAQTHARVTDLKKRAQEPLDLD